MDMKEVTKKGFQKISKAASNAMGYSTDICITKKEKNCTMRIDHDNLRKVLLRPEIGDLPVAIISIAGSSRTGKSFLMNFIARYLKDTSNLKWMDNEGTKFFQWRGGTKRTTTGIRVSNEVFKIQKDGREVAVLLMDTQGLFDSKTPEDVNTTLLTLSTLMSSVQIFNTQTTVNTQDLKYLKTCVDFAMATAQTNGPYFKLQSLVFLVRDSCDECDDSGSEEGADDDISQKPVQPTKAKTNTDFGFERGKKYMTDFLGSDEGGPEHKAIRQRIIQSFNSVECFMMPFPGGQVLTKRFTGSNHELSDEFKENVKQFVEDIARPDNLPIKTSWNQSGGQPARKILNMIAACDNLFVMKLYDSKGLMEANVKAYYASEYEDAILQYDKLMQDAERKCGNIDELRKQHTTSKKFSIRRYENARQLGDGNEREFYSKHLVDKCEGHFKTTVEIWEAKQSEEQAKRTLKTAAAFAEYESLMQKNPSKGSALDEKLENYHNENLQRVLQKNAGKIDTDVLRNRTEHYFSEVKRVNDERRENEEKLGKERRERKLFGLAVKLQDEASKMWTEKLKSWIPEEKLTRFEGEVKKEISEKYFNEAILPIEEKYRKKLNALMNEEYEKVEKVAREQTKLVPDADGKGMEQLKRRVLSELKKECGEEENKCQVIVANVLVGYVSDLQHDLDVYLPINDLKKEKLNKMNKYRLIYYASCCVHLETYYTDVQRMLEKKFVEAKERNEQNWENIKDRLMTIVHSSVLEVEKNLEEKMADQYLDKEKLRAHYVDLKTQLAENAALKFMSFMGLTHPKISNEFKRLWIEKLEESYEKMEKLNEENKKSRNLETQDLHVSSSWWKKLLKAIKEAYTRE